MQKQKLFIFTLYQFIHIIKMYLKAQCQLLERSISEVAEEWIFSDNKHLIGTFSQLFGVSANPGNTKIALRVLVINQNSFGFAEIHK